MDVLYDCVCGLDVHKATVVACVRRIAPGGKIKEHVRTFGTMTGDLLDLSDWLHRSEVSHVAMESTGAYWKPIHNIIEGQFALLLVNAQHIKQVPGRKTDIKDCQWIAQLLQCGLLRSSFVPSRPIRELRDLTRHRATLVQEKVAVGNRIHKVLEDANIKLASVAANALGVSGRAMIESIIRGEEDRTVLADLARRRLRQKIPQLRSALAGRVHDHHRFQLQLLFEHLKFLEAQVEAVGRRIEDITAPFEEVVQLLTTVAGGRSAHRRQLLIHRSNSFRWEMIG